MQISAPHFTAGIVIDTKGSAVRCAPILNYMRGWTATQIKDYCKRKGWTCTATSDDAIDPDLQLREKWLGSPAR